MRSYVYVWIAVCAILFPACVVIDADCYPDDLDDDDDDESPDWLDEDEPDWDEGPPDFIDIGLDDCTDSQDPCTDGDRVLIEANVTDPDGFDDVVSVDFLGPYNVSHLVQDPNQPDHWFVNHTFEGIEEEGAHDALFRAKDDVGRIAEQEITVYLVTPDTEEK